MTYRRLLVGDVAVARFWQAAQSARPQLREVHFRNAVCLETLESSLESVTDAYDLAIFSAMTSLIVEEGSAIDVPGSVRNILDQAFKRVIGCAKKSKRCEVVL